MDRSGLQIGFFDFLIFVVISHEQHHLSLPIIIAIIPFSGFSEACRYTHLVPSYLLLVGDGIG